MKKQFTIFTLLLVMLFVKAVTAQTSDWQWQNPIPQGNHLTDIHVFDENTAIAVGIMGTIIKTTNGGISWEQKESNTQITLSSVYFIDNNIGWVAGGDKVLKTIDGGTTWTTVIYSDGMMATSIFFIDQNIGWLTVSSGQPYKSTDGGITWQLLLYAPDFGGVDIQFFDKNVGCMISGGMAFRTVNGGAYWEISNIAFNNYHYPYAIHFVDASTGWVVGGNSAEGGGSISKTTDGGVTWTAQSSGIQEVLYSVCFADANTGWAVGDDKILHTIDGGANWTVQTTLLPENSISVKSVMFRGNSTGFVVGDFGVIYKTNNAGTDWVNMLTNVVEYNNNLYGIDFMNDTTGLAVGVLGSIAKTTDGGINWTAKSSGVTVPLNTVFMFDSITGWAVGGTGKIIKTTDGGESWTEQLTGVTNTLYGLHFPVDTLTGWVTGTSGRVLKTTNGGVTWTTLTSGVTTAMRTAYFIDNNTGYIAGGNKILKTINGGTSWTTKTVGTATFQANAIYFTDPATGWVVGSSGKIFRTQDSGANWEEIASGTSLALYSIKVTPTLLIAVGNNGTIIKSTDGGANWTTEKIGSYHVLYAVDLVNDSTIWAVGTKGAILHQGGSVSPAAYAVTGGGNYCEGTGGLPVGMTGSESGVTYTLFKNGVAQMPAVAGTGSPITFGNQLFGTYTVNGTNAGGTTPMTGSAVITETPAVVVSVSISADLNPVPEGSSVIFTATPVNGGATPSYQWKVNGSNAGTDNAVFTYTPAHNDAVTCTLTSSETCTTGNPATSNTVTVKVIPTTITLQNIIIANGETNCYNALQTIFVAGGETTFTVQPGGSATMIAGQNIIYSPETKVFEGGYLHGYISTEFCPNPSSPVAGNPVQTDVIQAVPPMVVNNSLRIYPNPAANQFTLELLGAETAGMQKLEIYSLSGRKVAEQDCSGNQKQIVSVTDLAPGVYVVKVMAGGERITLKLVKM